MTITINKINDIVTGVIGKSVFSIEYNQEIFASLQRLENEFENATSMAHAKDLVEQANTLINGNKIESKAKIEDYTENLYHNEETNQLFLKVGGSISNQPIPSNLADLILEQISKNNSITPLVRAWTLFLRNPKFTPSKAQLFANYILHTSIDEEQKAELIEKGYSEEKAIELSTYNDVCITKNGLLLTYKYGQEIKSGEFAEDYRFLPPVMGTTGDKLLVNGELTHEIHVGQIHSLPNWSYVNCNDDSSCVKGAHAGGRDYIRGYGGEDKKLLELFISPDKIGAINGSVIRVLEYFVRGTNFTENRNLFHQSNYAEKIESDWLNTAIDAIESSDKIIAKLEAVKLSQDPTKALNDLLEELASGITKPDAIANKNINQDEDENENWNTDDDDEDTWCDNCGEPEDGCVCEYCNSCGEPDCDCDGECELLEVRDVICETKYDVEITEGPNLKNSHLMDLVNKIFESDIQTNYTADEFITYLEDERYVKNNVITSDFNFAEVFEKWLDEIGE